MVDCFSLFLGSSNHVESKARMYLLSKTADDKVLMCIKVKALWYLGNSKAYMEFQSIYCQTKFSILVPYHQITNKAADSDCCLGREEAMGRKIFVLAACFWLPVLGLLGHTSWAEPKFTTFKGQSQGRNRGYLKGLHMLLGLCSFPLQPAHLPSL